MNSKELLQWQYASYEKFHRSRVNLLIHIVAVPLVVISSVALTIALFRLAWLSLAINSALIGVFMALQGLGHARETHPPEPFTGATNAISRIFLEQWITFPRFVLSGGWWRALQRSQTTVPSNPQIRS
jgi:hypothetical protein